MFPELEPESGFLPPGVHRVTWSEVVEMLGTNEYREHLLGGLRRALLNLRNAGCKEVWLDGSFTSVKTFPNDYDGAWEHEGVDEKLVDKVLLKFSWPRKAMKDKYLGELFRADDEAAPGIKYRDFFRSQGDGTPKGILLIDIASVT